MMGSTPTRKESGLRQVVHCGGLFRNIIGQLLLFFSLVQPNQARRPTVTKKDDEHNDHGLFGHLSAHREGGTMPGSKLVIADFPA